MDSEGLQLPGEGSHNANHMRARAIAGQTIQTSEIALLEALPAGLLIGGVWRPSVSGRTLNVEDPATGKMLLSVADAAAEGCCCIGCRGGVAGIVGCRTDA